MKRLVNKLRSEGGATILFAILVFMLCALVGAAALTAAAANSGRYTHVKEEQQEYLSMSSAVNLMREQLVGKTFTAQVEVKKEVKTPYTAGVAETPTETEELVSVTPDCTYDGGFSAQLLNVFTDFYLAELKTILSSHAGLDISSLGTGRTDPYEIELTFTTGDEVIDKYKVKANLTVDEDFNITLKFSFDGTNGDYGSNMTVRATMDGDVISTSSTSSTTSEYDGGTLKSTTTTTVTTYTMKVTWLDANATVVKNTLETEGA